MRPLALYRHPVERVGLLWTSAACLLGVGLAVLLWTPESVLDKVMFVAAGVTTAIATGYQALFPYCFVRDGKLGIRTVRGLRTVELSEISGVWARDARAPFGRGIYRYPAITVGDKVVPLDRAHYRPGYRRQRRIEEFLSQVEPQGATTSGIS
ncbi:hypothetical protein [Actinokineospora globicatena]|uniref:hypothetical protein n=1 Tax=Actinokineospora globicatena TaxID=103729 RepID=UPI0020A53F34|nr:hypothetical protein [Actinokineospora globicatena]MCP2305362.1 hypothetical protein [Actinokineospora globicatena]GLW80839.1 hypothetical protein Aglo01_53200 [Actinokineospora globicatena]GLW87666.1 hypothetical protein Aglo02_53050 [Actinokineospora globicatena]